MSSLTKQSGNFDKQPKISPRLTNRHNRINLTSKIDLIMGIFSSGLLLESSVEKGEGVGSILLVRSILLREVLVLDQSRDRDNLVNEGPVNHTVMVLAVEQVPCATTFPMLSFPGSSWATNGYYPARVSPGVVLSRASMWLGAIVEKRVRGLTLDEFLSYGPQRDPSNVIVQFLRFNIEPKFDDNLAAYKKDELAHALFQPDAAQSILKLQTTYPVSRVNKLFTPRSGAHFIRGTMDEIVDWGKVNKDRWIEIGQ
ncbi:hypothetical protein LguiA_004926 [Lonicera macranthoides]